MKIVTKVLEGIADIQLFPIIGLIIFFTFFVILIIQVARLSRQQVDEYSHLPLEGGDEFQADQELKNQ